MCEVKVCGRRTRLLRCGLVGLMKERIMPLSGVSWWGGIFEGLGGIGIEIGTEGASVEKVSDVFRRDE